MATTAQRLTALEQAVAALRTADTSLGTRIGNEVNNRAAAVTALDNRLKTVEAAIHSHPVAPEPGPLPAPALTDRPGLRLVFADTFDDRTIPRGRFLDGTLGQRKVGNVTSDGKWGAAYWQDTYRKGLYSASGISVEDGKLRILVATVDGVPRVADLKPITSVSDPDTGGITGPFTIEYRLRADAMPGYKIVNLGWAVLASGGGMGDYRTYGEWDFPERETDRQPYAYMHRRNGADSNDQDWYPTPTGTRFQDWHTYRVDFVPDQSITFTMDGSLVGRSVARVPGGSAFRPMIRVETNLNTTMPDPAVQGFYELDYVGVWVPA